MIYDRQFVLVRVWIHVQNNKMRGPNEVTFSAATLFCGFGVI